MYRIVRFGTVDLEYTNQVDTIGSGSTPVNYINLPDGGALDGFGSLQKHPGAVERPKALRLRATTQADVEALYFGLLSLRGKRDQLFRRTSQGDYHWMYARLVELSADRTYGQAQFRTIQDLNLRFICPELTWRGTRRVTWTLDDGHYLDMGVHLDIGELHALTASPCAFSIALGASTDPGRAPVKSMLFTVSAGSSSMSNITIARTGGESLVYAGTIPAGGTLTIDTGSLSVSCTGVSNAYNNLTVTPTAGDTGWFTLLPGGNTITVTYTAGGMGKSINVDFYEAWY